MPAIRVLPAETQDAARIAEIWSDAFREGTLWKVLFPPSRVSREDSLANGTKRFADAISLYKQTKRVMKAVVDVDGKEEIVAFALLAPALTSEELAAAPEEAPRQFPPGAAVEEAKAFFAKAAAINEALQQEVGPHLHLHVLASDAAFRTRAPGGGSALMRWGIETSEAQGVPFYLESTNEAMDFYPRFGFKPRGHPIVSSSGGARVVPMIRFPTQSLPR